MVFEKLVNKKTFILVGYIVGIILEIIGFASLFAFDNAMDVMHKFKILFALVLIVAGYVVAVSVRKK